MQLNSVSTFWGKDHKPVCLVFGEFIGEIL